jgi:Tfp pilus assembly protein PilF/predicted AlkP superfamily phosphohydrolase/phosphomutase
MSDRSKSGNRGIFGSRPARWGIVAIAVGLWLAAGVVRVDPDEITVLHGPLLAGRGVLVDGDWALAPPGLARVSTYPRYGVELPLPRADRAMLRASDGSRFGFQGWVTLRPRPEDWRELHEAAHGSRGLDRVLLDAVREAAAGLRPGSERGGDPGQLVRDLERGLSMALGRRGLDLRRLELSAIDFLAVGEGSPPPEPSSVKLLVVGLDGLDWEIVDALVEQGRLPTIGRLIDEGVGAKLLTISPMLSPVIWTTIATGVEPSRHGVIDFLVQDSEDGTRQPVTSAQREVPTFWEMLSRSGVEVGITGWWASWPADAVRGYLVSDRIAYQLFGYRSDPDDAQGKTWPPELYDRIRPWIIPPDSVPWEELRPYLDGARTEPEAFDSEERKLLEEFRTLLASGRTYLEIGDRLRNEQRPGLEVIYFEGTDTVGHLFMPYRPPLLPGVDPRRFESFSSIVDRYYETADRYLAQLLEGRDDSWTVMVVSDHGFATDATRPRSTDSRVGHGAAADWHRRFGVLILSGAHVRRGVRLGETSVYDIAPTILALYGQPVPRSWPGHVLGEALDEEFLDRHPVRYRLDEPVRGEHQAEGLVDPSASDLVAKLQSLGYVSTEGDSADSVTARNNAGVALMAEGRYAEAEQEFRAGLDAAPGSPMLGLNLGLALRLQGRDQEAERRFRDVLDHSMTRRMAGHLLAQILMDRGDLDEAQAVLEEVLRSEPDAAEIHNTMGQLLEKRGRIDEARERWQRAAALDPNAAPPRNNLGNLARRRGELDQAEAWYLEAIECDPFFMGAYNNLALVYQDQGEMERAHDLYARALAKAPGNAEVLNNLGSWHYVRGEYEEAGSYWNRAASADPTYPSPLNNLAGLEINAERFGEAERLLRRAIDLDPAYGDAKINLAIVLLARGAVDEARQKLEAAAQDPRTGANAWAKLGGLELEHGAVDRAIDVLERGREIDPVNVEVLNYLGEAYRRAGRPADAAAVWQRSLEIRPRQPRLREYLESGAVR